MASPHSLPTLHQSPLLYKSNLLGQTRFPITIKPSLKPHKTLTLQAKFNLSEILGGRGLCNGEQGLQQELKKPTNPQKPTSNTDQSTEEDTTTSLNTEENAFEKELLGFTGGFPGGEKGLRKFIEENPPPPPPPKAVAGVSGAVEGVKGKPKPPELPLLMPGMIAIVKNPNNPFYMYCGIVQRITDGKAGVLFEGGNWDRLVTFRLEELQRREKGPPMVNPRSAIFETMLENGL